MRFTDEKPMWYADTEALACRLADKSASDIQEILDDHDVITLASKERPNTTILERLAILIVGPIALILCAIKWALTGDHYLDSWEKKSRIVRWMFGLLGKDY